MGRGAARHVDARPDANAGTMDHAVKQDRKEIFIDVAAMDSETQKILYASARMIMDLEKRINALRKAILWLCFGTACALALSLWTWYAS